MLGNCPIGNDLHLLMGFRVFGTEIEIEGLLGSETVMMSVTESVVDTNACSASCLTYQSSDIPQA